MILTKHPALLASHLRYWQYKGITLSELSAAAGTEISTSERVSAEIVHRLYSYTEKRLNDPYMGLRIGHQILLADIAPVMNAVLYSADGWQMLRTVQHFWPLLSEIERLEIHIDPQRYHIRMVPILPELVHPQQTDTVLSGFLRLAAVLLGIDQTPDIGVNLRRSPPADEALFSRLAGAPVQFNQPHDELYFSRHVLDVKNPTGDPVRMRDALQDTQRLLSSLRSRVLADEISSLIRDQLAHGTPDQGRIAALLNISVRALQRRLQQQHTSFRLQLDQVRFHLARELVADSSLSFPEVATRLGYTETGSLFKAFKRWTGLTPGDYRLLYGSDVPLMDEA